MKHDLKVTIFLIILFLSAQIFGLFVLAKSMETEKVINPETGNEMINVTYKEALTGRPELQGPESFFYVLFAILLGTVLLFVLIKFRLRKVWKGWFFVAVATTLAISFNVFLSPLISIGLAVLLTALKIFKPNIITHNLSEVLMYSGIAVMFAPIFDLFWGVMLLLAISVYDYFAVFRSKHMVKLAKFQSSSKMFAGLLIPYKAPEKEKKGTKTKKTDMKKEKTSVKIHAKIPAGIKAEGVKSAILGGGDIAFPLIFSGVVMEHLISVKMMMPMTAYLVSLITSITAAAGLGILLYLSKKDKFYPAMPFITAGCLVGLGIVLLI